jgi:hypothetical protein
MQNDRLEKEKRRQIPSAQIEMSDCDCMANLESVISGIEERARWQPSLLVSDSSLFVLEGRRILRSETIFQARREAATCTEIMSSKLGN